MNGCWHRRRYPANTTSTPAAKELQRIIALHGGINLSVDKVLDIAKTIPTIKLSLPYGDSETEKTLFLTEKHQQIKPLFNIQSILKQKKS